MSGRGVHLVLPVPKAFEADADARSRAVVRDPKGRYEFNSHSGDIRIAVPGGGATLDVQTFSGDVDSDFPMTLQPGSRSGGRGKGMQFTIGGGGARITAQTFSGDITIQRASGASREE